MGKGKIDLGVSTENKPEWTISLDFNANSVVKDDLEAQSKGEKKSKGSRSIFNDALDSDFLSDDRSSFSDTQIVGGNSTGIAGGLDETIQNSGTGSSLGNAGSGDSILGAASGAVLGGADDSLTTIGVGGNTGIENDVFIGSQSAGGEKKNSEESIDYAEQSAKAVKEVVDQFSASMQAVVEQLSATVHAEHPAREPKREPVSEAVLNPDPVPEPISEAVLSPDPVPEPISEAVLNPDPVPEPISEAVLSPEPEPVSEAILNPEPEMVDELQEKKMDREPDEVEEKLAHLANSMDHWEQSEHALSEAATMLSKEEKVSEIGADLEEVKLKHLFDRLDISESLDRMNAAAQEDIADVIEQTQKDNELIEAIEVEPLDSAPEKPDWKMEMPESLEESTEPELVLEPEQIPEPQPEMAVEPEQILEPQPEMAVEPEQILEPQPETQKEEIVSPGEIEITNDMFDMGYDLSDEEENYSDENIDLDSFDGSINDAEQFSSSENSLDLDEAEHTGKNSAELDMSNLVAAAMSDLSSSHEEKTTSESEESNQVLKFDSESEDSENTLASNMPEESENTLEFAMPGEDRVPEEEESALSEAEFVSAPEDSGNTLEFAMPEESDNTLEFAMPEDSGNTLEFAMPGEDRAPAEEESALTEAEFVSAPEESGSSLEFAMPEENSSQPPSEEFQMEYEEPENEAEPEQIKLEFEPVFPEGQGPGFSGIIDDTAEGDVASMIIEDYSEVPKVSDVETKLKKREKEKKKNKGKENQQKKADGFAYSLEDIGAKPIDDIKQAEVKTLVGREAVEAALEVAAETAAAMGGTSIGAEVQSNAFTASVYAKSVVHKDGKLKRSYYSLFYK